MLIRVGGALGGARQPVEWIGTFPRHARSDKCLVSCSSNRSGRCKNSHMHSGGREGGRQPVEWISDVLSFMSAPIDSLVVSHHGGGYTRQMGVQRNRKMVSIEQGCRVMKGFRILLSIRLEIITMWRGQYGGLCNHATSLLRHRKPSRVLWWSFVWVQQLGQ